jgi:hypothetical protein
MFSLLRSKTFWGAVLMAGAKVFGDHSPTSIAEAVGGVISVAGARQAIAKNGEGK